MSRYKHFLWTFRKRTILSTAPVLARFGVLPVMVDIARQFHDGMRACVRLEGGRVS